jgi:serine/threonine protein kinase
MGVVWQARDERLGRTVAIKQLYLQPGLTDQDAEMSRRRAMREARIAAMLQHPNAIAIFDIAEHDEDPCLVMEYLPSTSLGDLLTERGSLSPGEVAAIGAQVASALDAAHAKGIVHRDVKPGNILIAENGVAKITDFGISRAIGDTTVTQTGMLAGTPAYLAPEIARGQDPTSASDVFALGATLYTAVEGAPPFGYIQNQLAALHAAAAGKVLPPQQAGQLTALLMSLLRTDPVERPSMHEASSRLIAIAPNDEPVYWPEAVPAPAPEPAQTRVAAAPVAERTEQPREPRRREPATAAIGGASKRRSRIGLLAGLLAVVLLGGLIGTAVANDWFGSGEQSGKTTAAAGPTSNGTAQPAQPNSPSQSTRESAPTSEPRQQAVTSGQIDWSSAGQLVINYYNGFSNPTAAWQMLSPGGQAAYGSQQAFAQHWGQYKSVSASHATGVTPNSDGSVNVPVDVVTDGSSAHKTVRVVQQNGQLLIDGDTR